MKCNSSKGLLKRFIPFFLTFAAGLLIASFFVPVTAPSFQFGRARRQHRAQDEQMQRDYQRVVEENINLKMKLKEAQDRSADWQEYGSFDVPAPPMPPLPPVAMDAGPAPLKAPAAPKRVK